MRSAGNSKRTRTALYHGRTSRPNFNMWEEATLNQLRSGFSPLSNSILMKIGKAESSLCSTCGVEDDVPHMLLDCADGEHIRRRLYPPGASLEDMFEEPAKLIHLVAGLGRDTVAPPSLSAQ
jgi:hypothetical protein